MERQITTRQDFIDYIEIVAQEVDELVVGNDKVRKRFEEHVQKVLSEAEKYGEYLRGEYNEAKQKGYTTNNNKPDGEDWYWYSAYNKRTTEHFAGEMVTFWMKGKPKIDPLNFVYAMAHGSAGKLNENLNLLDYQYFLVTCIHDAQRWVAGQEQILFNPSHKNELKNAICRNIWDTVNRNLSDLNTLKDIQTTIQTALQAIRRDVQIYAKKSAETEQKAVPAEWYNRMWIWLKRIPNWIYVLVIFLAALLTIFHYLGWLERIKAFIYNVLGAK